MYISFCTYRSPVRADGRLPDGVRQALSRIGLCVTLVRLCRAGLRYTFAVAVVQKGLSLPTLQRLLEHDQFLTTEIYKHSKMDYLVLERQTLTINPIKPGHFLRQGRPLPKKLSQDQVGTLLAQVTNPMDHALELLRLRCGLRVSEVARLRRSDLDWEQHALRIDQGKGRKDHV